MKLYYSPGACSLSPHIALHEAGIACETVLTSTKSHKLQDGTDFYAINPLGYVPLLELDYRLQEWLTFIGTELHKGFSPLFNPKMPEEAKAIAKEKLAQRYEWLNGQLEGKEWLSGEHFSVADGYLFTVTNWAQPTGVDLSPYPNVQAWHARVAARPGVQAAMKAEGLLK